MFDRAELELIAGLCQEHDVVALTDDIYQHIVFDGEHVPLATIPGMADRTIAIDSMSKTYSVTGWRIGWTIASPELSIGIRRVHDFLTVGAAAPLQAGGGRGAALPGHATTRGWPTATARGATGSCRRSRRPASGSTTRPARTT